ncbi:TolC family protein [Longimicrobium terrae]|uniref:Outer membrane protein TolC n=1 Tax=Longimicrobium terrae TaxID=1639882 RepID=A0A841H5B5_9BACT|nr:TolC family protein [Longimicrobium terrae]MBB4639001.1 outer membrane protein TolC [Longimicrobium terrae]MBB6073240.1 outer membrane protein TolC [Longimicrobium terrae]NNC32309.1 TolC family protein [Longimicrobium terrae]
MPYTFWKRRALPLVLGAVCTLSVPLAAQTGEPRPLSLRDALARAAASSEAVAVARGGITGARGQRITARAQRLPQINSNFSYTRTLISQFQSAAGGGAGSDTTAAPPPECATPFMPDSTLPLETRIARLEQALLCPAAGLGGLGGFDISRAGFGSTNAYQVGFSLNQPIYTGGRIGAQNRIADASLATAELEVTAQSAQVVVDVAQSYYDALLSARLLQIAESSLAQAEQTLRLSELGFQVGDKAEYDVLRARVARNNQRNGVVQARSNRDIAFFRLKQLLDLPLDETVVLTTPLNDEIAATGVTEYIEPGAADTTASARVPVRQAEQAMRIQEGQVAIARSQARPNVSVVSNYGLTGYPQGLIPTRSDFADNLTVGLQVALPIFDGGRIRGGVVQAQGSLEQARARLAQTREGAVLDARSRQEAVETARATLASSEGSVEEAQRAYEIAQIRYQQGIATLIEVNDARLALSQSQADRAQATRNLLVAEVQYRLVRDLPLGSGAGTAAPRATGTTTGAAGAAGTSSGFGTGAGASGASFGGAGASAGAAGGAGQAGINPGAGGGR